MFGKALMTNMFMTQKKIIILCFFYNCRIAPYNIQCIRKKWHKLYVYIYIFHSNRQST